MPFIIPKRPGYITNKEEYEKIAINDETEMGMKCNI